MKWKFDSDGSDFTDLLSNLTQVKVFKEIILTINKEDLKWTHTKEERERISTKLKTSEVTFKRALHGIVESGLMHKLGRGCYQINPSYVSYGANK